MKIYTRTGDQGETGLFGGARVSKADMRVAAYGDVDELNSVIGVARSESLDPTVDGLLAGIAASLIGWALARFAFRLDYLPQAELWIVGMLAGIVLVVVAGWLGASSMLRQSALPALRAAQ